MYSLRVSQLLIIFIYRTQTSPFAPTSSKNINIDPPNRSDSNSSSNNSNSNNNNNNNTGENKKTSSLAYTAGQIPVGDISVKGQQLHFAIFGFSLRDPNWADFSTDEYPVLLPLHIM